MIHTIALFNEKKDKQPIIILQFEDEEVKELKPFFDKIMNYENYYCGTLTQKKNMMYVSLLKYLDINSNQDCMDMLKIATINNEYPLMTDPIISGQNTNDETLYRVFNGGVTKHTPLEPLNHNHIPTMEADQDTIWDYPKTAVLGKPKVIMEASYGRIRKIKKEGNAVTWTNQELAEECNIQPEMLYLIRPYKFKERLEERGFDVEIKVVETTEQTL